MRLRDERGVVTQYPNKCPVCGRFSKLLELHPWRAYDSDYDWRNIVFACVRHGSFVVALFKRFDGELSFEYWI